LFNPQYGLLYVLLFHAINVFCEIIIGTESNSKYGIIGGSRAYFQTLAGYMPFMLSILVIYIIVGSFNFIDIVEIKQTATFDIWMWPLFVVFFITTLILLNRTPFDFPEAESELVAGNYVEYGGILFGMLYLSEYINLLFYSGLIVVLFLGGWHAIPLLSFIPSYVAMLVKTGVVLTCIVLIRSILPRQKQMTAILISWKVLCPIVIVYIILFEILDCIINS
jgi:NADH-quinone oxidoreductase subunit H